MSVLLSVKASKSIDVRTEVRIARDLEKPILPFAMPDLDFPANVGRQWVYILKFFQLTPFSELEELVRIVASTPGISRGSVTDSPVTSSAVVPDRATSGASVDASRDRIRSLRTTARICLAQGDLAGGRLALEERLSLARSIVESDPGSIQADHDLAAALTQPGDVLSLQGDEQALQQTRDALVELARSAAEPDATLIRLLHENAAVLEVAVKRSRVNGDLATAVQVAETALEVRHELLRLQPGSESEAASLCTSLESLGELQELHGDVVGARESYREAVELRRELTRYRSGSPPSVESD